MSQRGRLCGDWLCILNMAACGKGVVLMQFRVLGLGGGKMLAGLEEFYRFIRFDVGDGSKIKFWYDVWCRDQALTADFLELYSISRFKEASVADDLQFSNRHFTVEYHLH